MHPLTKLSLAFAGLATVASIGAAMTAPECYQAAPVNVEFRLAPDLNGNDPSDPEPKWGALGEEWRDGALIKCSTITQDSLTWADCIRRRTAQDTAAKEAYTDAHAEWKARKTKRATAAQAAEQARQDAKNGVRPSSEAPSNRILELPGAAPATPHSDASSYCAVPSDTHRTAVTVFRYSLAAAILALLARIVMAVRARRQDGGWDLPLAPSVAPISGDEIPRAAAPPPVGSANPSGPPPSRPSVPDWS